MATKIAIKMATKCALVPVEMSFMANLGFLLKYVFSAWYLRTSSMNNELGCQNLSCKNCTILAENRGVQEEEMEALLSIYGEEECSIVPSDYYCEVRWIGRQCVLFSF